MKEGEDYLIAPNPKDEHDWCVIFKGQYDRVVGSFTNIEITEQSTKLSFMFVPLHQPLDVESLDTPEFQNHTGEVLSQIIRDHHDKESMIYYSKETGERVEF